MKRFFYILCICIGLGCFIIGNLIFIEYRGFQQYLSTAEYRRMHPELLPSPDIIRVFDMGQTASYASWSWLALIQYIGDNIAENKFLDFSHTLLKNITILHPYFIKPYELDLIFSPQIDGISDENKKRKAIEYKEHAIELGKTGIHLLCNEQKIQEIISHPINTELWSREDLHNPCSSGMLPYYLGFASSQIEKYKKDASIYYKIASMNEDAPKSSRTLAILSLASDGDYRASAITFGLVGLHGYDEYPFVCKQQLQKITEQLQERRGLNKEWIQELIRIEGNLKKPGTSTDNPLSYSTDSCYEMMQRSIKSIYIGYVTEKAKDSTAMTGDELVQSGTIPFVPYLSTQSGFTLMKRNNAWEYIR